MRKLGTDNPNLDPTESKKKSFIEVPFGYILSDDGQRSWTGGFCDENLWLGGSVEQGLEYIHLDRIIVSLN